MRENVQLTIKIVCENKHLISSLFLLLLSWLVIITMIEWISF